MEKSLINSFYHNNNILIIRMAPYYTTQAIPRLANFLKNNGFNVSILAMDRNNKYSNIQNINGWKIYWEKLNYKSGNKLSFIIGWLKWWKIVIKHLYQNDYLLIHAMNLESIIPVVIGKYILLKKYKIIYDVRDPWGMLFPRGNNIVKNFIVLIDRFFASKVNGILLSQGILEKTGEYFGSKARKKIPIIQVLNVPGEDLAGKYLALNDFQPLRINFSGHISYKRNAQAVIDLAKEFPKDIQIDVVGPIRDQKLLKELEKVKNIKYYGYLSYDDAMQYIKKSHLVLILYDTSTDIAIVASANKMFEAMMLSRPYIASKNGFPGRVADKYNLGFTIEFGSSKALIDLIKKILKSPAQLEEMAKIARATYEKEFKWEKQENNIKLLYETVLDIKVNSFSSFAGWSKVLGNFYLP